LPHAARRSSRPTLCTAGGTVTTKCGPSRRRRITWFPSWARLAAGERKVTDSLGAAIPLRVGPPTHPVADEVQRHCDPGEEERCDAPGRCVTAAMSARVCEDASRDRCGKSNAQHEGRGTRTHRRTIRAAGRLLPRAASLPCGRSRVRGPSSA
jgi:hypothetical protein